MKKKAIACGIVLYVIVVLALRIGDLPYEKNGEANLGAVQVETGQVTDNVPQTDVPENSRQFEAVNNTREYSDADSQELYNETSRVSLMPGDTEDIIKQKALPALERMAQEDQKELMGNLQVLKRIENLGAVTEEFNTPEYNWKVLYQDSINTVDAFLSNFTEKVIFDGDKASELNAFLNENVGKVVEIAADKIELDETISVPSNSYLNGNGVIITGENSLDYGILLENAENICLQNLHFAGGMKHAVYIISSENVLLNKNIVEQSENKGIVVMGTNSYINLVKNQIFENGDGAIFLNGKITNCIIENNIILNNRGANNFNAGISISSIPITDLKTPYNAAQDEYLYDITEVPYNNVIRGNEIKNGFSSGIYSHGGYQNYIIDNNIVENDKEGICLDFGSYGNYIANNDIIQNGGRRKQSDTDLENDFIKDLGRLEDGSSPAKLPGISLDNAAYNIIMANNVDGNYGSGIKMVRSGYRNLIIENIISDNNIGENQTFHFFGVELGYAQQPDQPVEGMDFTSDYENIVCRNIISGGHYSGIFLAEEAYCNDMIDNVILDCKMFSIECLSDMFNSTLNNDTNVAASGIELIKN